MAEAAHRSFSSTSGPFGVPGPGSASTGSGDVIAFPSAPGDAADEGRPAAVPSVHTTGFVALDLLVLDGIASAHAGGTAANIAANLSLLGWRGSVSGMIGDDDAGRAVVADLNRFGVDTGALELTPGVRTPVVIHEVAGGHHQFRFSCRACGRAYAKHRPLPQERADGAMADVFVFDRTTAYAVATAELARAAGRIVVFEPGTPGRAEPFARAAAGCHVLRYSHSLADRLADRLPRAPDGLEIVGQAERGVTWRGRWGAETEEDWQRQPPAGRTAVDPGGAGDWLTAGTIDALIRGASISDSIARGQRLAALCCQHPGTRAMAFTASGQSMLGGPAAGRLPVPPPPLMEIRRDECDAWYCQSGSAGL